MRPALWLALFVKPQKARRVVVEDIAFLLFGEEVRRLHALHRYFDHLGPYRCVGPEQNPLSIARVH